MISYFVRREDNGNGNCDRILQVGENLFTGENDFKEAFGKEAFEPLTSLESDLLLISASIFAADRATVRGEREDITREIELQIPVTNSGRLESLTSQIEEILRNLSHDTWIIKLRQVSGNPERDIRSDKEGGRTLLFSGGLDSLAAAIEFGQQKKTLQLVSHITRNSTTIQAQRKLVACLKDHGLELPHHQFFVSSQSSGPSQFNHAVEDTQRTRSFLFLVLGALVARRVGNLEVVYLAENGQMAIHLPLTQARIGAFSTHTAHPDVLVGMEAFLSEALNRSFKILNPYVHLTKAEVVKKIINFSPDMIQVANSCWRSARLGDGITHCGECIPCFIRRIAIEYSISEDPTAYGKDCWGEEIGQPDPENTGRRNIFDLAEFILRIEKSSTEEIKFEWPELYSRNINDTEVIAMYKRFSKEARIVLSRYSTLESLLS